MSLGDQERLGGNVVKQFHYTWRRREYHYDALVVGEFWDGDESRFGKPPLSGQSSTCDVVTGVEDRHGVDWEVKREASSLPMVISPRVRMVQVTLGGLGGTATWF
jgi:hypothetical protein